MFLVHQSSTVRVPLYFGQPPKGGPLKAGALPDFFEEITPFQLLPAAEVESIPPLLSHTATNALFLSQGGQTGIAQRPRALQLVAIEALHKVS